MPTSVKMLCVDAQPNIATETDKFPANTDWEWHCTRVETAQNALEQLQQEQFDVVISELNLPDQDGSELIKQIAAEYPGTVRFILSSCTDRETILKTAGSAHQFIAKPGEPEILGKLISNSLGMRRLLSNAELHRRIASIKSLPSLPDVYNDLVSEIQMENCSMRRVAGLISRDVGITAKLLQMVNSAFFGLPTHVESPLHAVNLLGLDTVQSLVLTAGVFQQFEGCDLPGISIDSIHNNSMAVGSSARLIATAFGLNRRPAEEALMAGMLHDVGKLVMLANFRDEITDAMLLSQEEKIPLWKAQKKILGVSDAQIGAHLLSLWGLPDNILEAVALHYRPVDTPHPLLNVLTTVHIAFALNQDLNNNIRDAAASSLDMDYLLKLGLADQLQNIKNLSLAAAF
ncbi:MAG TPA: response regulator [candidate division Zixibacteria bacterium]|nr:response regulator [candidate division Zixibacteria bacterium]